jgi:hypothetical protein
MDHQILSRYVDAEALEVDVLDLAISGEVNRGVSHFESLKAVAELLWQLVLLDAIPPQPSALVLLEVQFHEQQLVLALSSVSRSAPTPAALAKSVVEAPLGSYQRAIHDSLR